MSRIFTVTVDGVEVGRRTSKSRVYTHALLAPTPTPAAFQAAMEAHAAEYRSEADDYEALLGLPIVIKPARFPNQERTHQAYFEGHEDGAQYTPCWNREGIWVARVLGSTAYRHRLPVFERTTPYGTEWAVVRVKDALTSHVADDVARLRAEADKTLAEEPRFTWVVSWHTSEALAHKALRQVAERHLRWHGATLQVVPVD